MSGFRFIFLFLAASTYFLSITFAHEASPDKVRPTLLLEKAKDLETKGDYLRAKEIYKTLLERQDLGERISSIRKAYGAVELKIIFSPLETPDSLFHEVTQGDTLHDLAKKYGTTVELLRRSNNLASDGRIYPGMKLKVTKTLFSVIVEKRRNHLTLLANGRQLKRYRVATGEKGSTPTGTFKIINKLKNPTWFHAGVVVPPESPQNILGSRWLGFDHPGYGIHGTTLPRTIGTQSSKGCIRMLNSDVEEIYDLIPIGTYVTVKE